MRNDGRSAEEWVAERYDLELAAGEGLPGWVDAYNPRTGARYQVKSAATRDEGPPRVRLWEDQHRAAVGYLAHAPAWYVFLRVDRLGRVLEHARRRPQTVTRTVNELGGWNQAGHEVRDARQLKAPVAEFL